jgi:ubiquinone biosynthesis protein COQ4
MSISRHLPRPCRSIISVSKRCGLSTPSYVQRPTLTRFASTTPAYEGHIPLNWFENAFLAVGSALMSLADPRRGGESIQQEYMTHKMTQAKDMIAALAETTAGPSLPRLRDTMLESAEGRKILRERPRVNSSTINMNELAQHPEGTFGRAYVTWLERCGVTPDTREPVSATS